jgi:hypothetical protein
MSLELLDSSRLKGLLDLWECRVRENNIPTLFQFNCPLQGAYLDFSPYALGTLTPFQLDGVEVML